MAHKTILWSYFHSSCSWRVRIALHLKSIPYEYHAVNLLKNSQMNDEYTSINPTRTVPTLAIDGHVLRQSLSILEYLDETRPQPPLLPRDSVERAKVRQIANIIACDTQPVQNRRVLKMVGEKKLEWAQHWISFNFDALERILSESSGGYCVGNSITMADVCLVPQVANAHRFKVDMNKYPTITRINHDLMKLTSFQETHPRFQPDRPEDVDV